MCGRYSRDLTWEQIVAFSRALPIAVPEQDPEPAYNICPTQPSWVLIADDAGALAQKMRWGLVPGWSKDTKRAASMINARLETVAEKPAFRSAWKSRRCLVPASGYYEWRLENGFKQPYWIHDSAGPVLMFAGLWENWKEPISQQWWQTFSIITRAAIDPMQQLHDRTPVMLRAEALHGWLHGDAATAAAITGAATVPDLVWHPVNRAVSNPRSSGAQLIEPIETNA